MNDPISALRFSPQALRRTTADSSARLKAGPIFNLRLRAYRFEGLPYIISLRTSSGGMAMAWMVVSPASRFTTTCTGDSLGALL